jgi:DNA-binding beta-propeller fold protein YncE
MTSRATAGRTAAAVLALSAVAVLALPAAQGAAPRITLVSCVNSLFGNEPAALNRCQDARRLRYEHLTVTETAVYTADEREALESWPLTSDGRIAKGSCYVGYRNDLGCEVVPGNSFQPREMTSAADGRQLYVSNFGEGITIFEVGQGGALRFAGCVGTAGFGDSCAERVPGTDGGAFMAFDLAVSPDGGRLYVTDYRGLQTFRRLSGGGLEYVGCLKLARSTCASTQNRPFVAENAEVAVSGDSRFVYVMGGGGAAEIRVKGQPVEILTVLERTEGSPGLRLVQELKMPVWGTDRGTEAGVSVALPADGRHVYVTDRNRLATVARDAASGKVRLLGCLGNDDYAFDTRRCMHVHAPGKALEIMDEPSDLALTADGRGLAVVSDDGLFFLRRNVATGALGGVVKRGGRKVATLLACAQTSKASGPCQTDVPFQGWAPEHIALSRRGDRAFTTTFSSQVLASVTAPFARSARSHAGAAITHRLGLNSFVLGRTRVASKRVYTFAEIPWLSFALGVDLISEHGSATDTTEAVRLTLPAGLSWGAEPAWARTLWPAGVPDYWSFTPDAEACEVQGQVATCRADGVPSGTNLFGWILDATASKPGVYKVTGEVVPPADGRNIPPRGKQTPGEATLTLVVGERSGPVAVGKVVLSRPRPSWVVATVEVKQGGEGVRPGSGTCTASFRSLPAYGKRTYPATLRRGAATCVYGFNNARYAGKTLLGELAFVVGKTKVKRSFSVRIGPGTSLVAPKGAVLKR